MKRILTTVSVVALVLCLAFVGIRYAVEAYDHSLRSPQMAPLMFDSFEKYEAHAKSTKDSSEAVYYIPTKVPDGFEFAQVRMRENVYVSVEYRLNSTNKSTEDSESYAAERMNNLICNYSIPYDGEVALNNSYIPNGFEPFEYKGKTYYRLDEIYHGKTCGYELVFLEEGHLIYLHLPAIDTFENMMAYAEVEKVEIK